MKQLLSAANFAGITLGEAQIEQFRVYGDWLGSEGVSSGGIGPEETKRLDRRHLADSVLFASQFNKESETVWDLGSGVGLPGVPLAISLPEIEFTFVDRSGRRTDLLRRVVRILDLTNCQVVEGEINRLQGRVSVIVARASLPPASLRPVCIRHLSDQGVAVVGGSWQQRPQHDGWETIEIPPEVLDQTVWLLKMRRA